MILIHPTLSIFLSVDLFFFVYSYTNLYNYPPIYLYIPYICPIIYLSIHPSFYMLLSTKILETQHELSNNFHQSSCTYCFFCPVTLNLVPVNPILGIIFPWPSLSYSSFLSSALKEFCSIFRIYVPHRLNHLKTFSISLYI